MTKVLSPGQKRRKIVTYIAIAVFLALTLVGSVIIGKINSLTHDWFDNHSVAQATVTSLYTEDESYRNLKGRKRESTYYYVEYTLTVAGEDYESATEIERSEYNALAEGDLIEVWYSTDEPYFNDTRANVESAMAMDNPVGYAVSAAPYSAAAAFFVFKLLAFFFVRESKKALPEGFFTQRSWLDVDDKVLVIADKNDIVFFDIHKNRVSEVQAAYQNGATLEQLMTINKTKEVTRIPMSEITGMRSDHNTDTISLEHNDEWHSVEFLNIAVKEHALRRFKLMVPDSFEYKKVVRTRLKAITPSLIWLAVIGALFAFLNIFLVKVVIVIAALYMVLPKLIKQLWNPTQTELWITPQAG